MGARRRLTAALVVVAGCSTPAHALRDAAPAATTTSTTSATSTTMAPTTTTAPSPPPLPAPAPVIQRVKTSEPVVFVTIDDGWDRDPAVIDFVRTRHWPVTAFLVADAAAADPGYFHSLQQAGATIEDHTVDHPRLAGMPAADQVHEICDASARLAFLAGGPVRLLRPPYGAFDAVTRQATTYCGLDAVIGWNAEMAGGRLKVIGGRLRAGNIVLLHFRAGLTGDLAALEQVLAGLHLGVGRLEDFVPRRAPSA